MEGGSGRSEDHDNPRDRRYDNRKNVIKAGGSEVLAECERRNRYCAGVAREANIWHHRGDKPIDPHSCHFCWRLTFLSYGTPLMLTAFDLLTHLAGAGQLPNLQQLAAEAPYRTFATAVASDPISARSLSAIDFVAGHTLRAVGAGMPEAAPPPRQPSEIAALAAAVELAARADLKRAEADARLLADQSAQEVADCLNVGPETIDAYERYFCDVRVRRSDPQWVREWILPLEPDHVLQRHDVALLWKRVGYQYGAAILDELIRSVPPTTLARQGVDSYVRHRVSVQFELKLWIAMERIPTPRTPKGLQMLQNYLRLKEVALEAKRSGVDLAPNLSYLLKANRILPVEDCLLRLAMMAIRQIK